MSQFVIGCDTVLRLNAMLEGSDPALHPSYRTIRIEGQLAIACDRQIMAVERITGGEGVTHLRLDPALIAQCKIEEKFSGSLSLVANAMLNFTSVKTTFGWQSPENLGFYEALDGDWYRWREVVMLCAKPLDKAHGGMFMDAALIARLAAAAPSGSVAFESIPTDGSNRPTLIRDVTDPNWLGVFQPFQSGTTRNAAVLPEWMTAA